MEREVTLPDGTRQTVLVPQVYVRVQPGDLDGTGTLLSAERLALNLTGDLTNSGTVAGRTALAITAENVKNLGGRLTAQSVDVHARQDLNNLGGLIDAGSRLAATAGRDLNVATTTTSTSTSTSTPAGPNGFERTTLDRVAGLYVSEAGATLLASAGRDLVLQAAQVNHAGAGGNTVLSAGRDLTLGTVATSQADQLQWNRRNWLHTGQQQDVGTQIQATGDVALLAGRDLSARAASVSSEHGGVLAQAARDLTVDAGQARQSYEQASHIHSRRTLSKKTTTTHDQVEHTQALGSTFSAETVDLLAARDLTVRGSDVVSSTATTLAAGRHLTIEAATESTQEQHFKDTRRSGVFTSGASLTIGKQRHSTDAALENTTARGATVGSVQGNVLLQAGGAYRQTGSDVLAPGGNIDIAAQRIEITEATEASRARTEQRFRQSGLSVSVSNSVVSAAQGVVQMGQAAGEVRDPRLKALAAGSAALTVQDTAATMARDPKSATSVGINLSVGSSKSRQTHEQSASEVRGSTLRAGGNVSIRAEGAGTDSDLTIRGSEVHGSGNVRLKADGDITLQAAANTAEQHSTQSSQSGSIGVGLNFGGSRTGLSFQASASRARGQADGTDLTWTHTHVQGAEVQIESGANTTLQGASVQAERVRATVGGDLSIQSVQDTSTYDSQHRSASGGVSLCVPPLCSGASSANASLSQTKVQGEFASVSEQSGIRAGDGGFDVKVQGHTALHGGLIASTQAAVDEGRNRLVTGTLSTRDLENKDVYEARSTGVSAGTRGASAGHASVDGRQRSTTRSGISGAEILITDAAAQQERTGQTAEQALAALNREVLTGDDSGALSKRWDGQDLQKEVQAGARIVESFGQQAAKAVGDYAQRKREDLKLQAWQAEQSGDVQGAIQLREEAARWDEGGAYHVLMHTLTGSLGGGLQGALSSGATAQAAPLIEQITAELPLSEPLQAVAGLVLSSAIGAATGGPGGAAQAFNVDANNRSLHRSERKMAIALAKEFGGRYSVQEIEAQLRQMPNVLLLQSGAAALYIDMQDPKTQQRWMEDRAQDPHLPFAVQGNSIVETQGRAHGELQALIIAATTFKDGPLAGHSPYLMSPQAARDLLSQAASSSPSSSAPRYFDCANTTCLTYGANYNREHPANQAEMQRTADMLKAAGVIISAPALAAVLATPQGMIAVQTLLWNPASAASAAAGVGANAAVQYATTGSVDPKGVVVSGVTGAVGGGATRLLTQGGAMPTVVGHGAALTTVIGTNAAGAAVTGSDQPATALGSVAGYGVGQLPSPYGPPLSALAQELVTWWFSRTPEAPTADKKEAK